MQKDRKQQRPDYTKHVSDSQNFITSQRLIHGDFLKHNPEIKGNYKVFANIPYFITTQIVEKLTQGANRPTDIWLIME